MSTLSALICTRNRPQSIQTAVASLLATDNDHLEVIIIDQSTDDASQLALGRFIGDRRIRYVRSTARGKGAALNEGLHLAAGSIVVCTDDDCEVAPGWPNAMARILESQPRAAILFCNVTAPTYDITAGYIPAYVRAADRTLSSVSAATRGIGLGAGMAVRRETVLAIGGFDESFGPGSRFGSGDDWDISIRLLLKGWTVYETAQLSVTHNGFRTFAEGRDHALRDWIAIGALFAKPIRAGYMSVLPVAGWFFVRDALWPPASEVLRLKRPGGRSRIAGFIRGFVEGFRTPVDPTTLLFADRNQNRPHDKRV
jgi:GT2 family glycosyltransferase